MDVNNETVLPVRIDRMKEKIEERQRRKGIQKTEHCVRNTFVSSTLRGKLKRDKEIDARVADMNWGSKALEAVT
jgi:hypothetical protein